MKKIVLLAFLILLAACYDQISKENLSLLNGYWEIEKVSFPDGNTKSYTANTAIDFITIEGTSGYKKKVYPKLDGTFETSNDFQPFVLIGKEDGFEIQYKNNLNNWVERIDYLADNAFSVTNEEGITYSYKRFEPINITP